MRASIGVLMALLCGPSDEVGDEWRHYPLGWHWVLVLFGGLVLFPLAAAFCGPKKPPGELVIDAEYGAAK